jgi:NAD(P)-dependent dehydrogenase (short-subunit alcohol dehydrogenase family)
MQPLGTITEALFDLIVGVNVKSTLFTVQKALPLMKAGGSIILTSSTTGSMGTPAFSVYSATKAAVRNLARSWALDLKGTGIRVNVLSPGATATPGLLDGLARAGEQDALIARLIAQTPLGRIGKTRRLPASLYEVLRWRPRPVARCSGLCTTCTWCRRSSTLVSRIESASFYSSGASARL